MYKEILNKTGSDRKAARSLNINRSAFRKLLYGELGLCPRCGKNPPKKDKINCVECLEKAKTVTPEQKVKRKETNKSYKAENKEHLREWSKEYYHKTHTQRRAYYNAYYSDEKRKIPNRIKQQRYRALKKSDVNLTPLQIQNLFTKFKNKCFNCGSTDRLELDHHIPLSKGGKLIEGNVVILCKSCNSGKRDLLPEDFYTEEQLQQLSTLLK